jgi:NTP pyrophosphatase (non-canonical NTP hydrolase)
MDLTAASERAVRVRSLYHQLEERHEGSQWEIKDDMLGLVNDVGTLARLVMATTGQWVPEGDVTLQARGKLGECMWWILVLADRLDIDIDAAYSETMDRIEERLTQSITRLGE